MSHRRVRLVEVADFNPPTPRGLLSSEQEVAIVPMAAVSELGLMRVQEYQVGSRVKPGLSYFADGDVLIAKITPCYENNKVTVAQIDRAHGFGSTEFHVLRPREARADARYLCHFIRQDAVREAGQRRMTGSAGQRRVPRAFLEQLEIPLPPLEEQRRIAAILDQADALRCKRREAITQIEGLTQVVFRDMFGEWGRLDQNPSLVEIGPHLDFLTSGSRGWANQYSDSGSLFLRVQNVKRDRLDLSDIAFVNAPATAEARRTKVEPGDVLLSITADLGRTAVVPETIGHAFINQHLAILRTRAFQPRYLSAAFASPSGQRMVKGRDRGGVKSGLNFDDIKSFAVPDAPKERQFKFATIAREIDGQVSAEAAHLVKLDDMFFALQQRTFAGKS